MTVRWVELSFILGGCFPSVAVLERRLADRLPEVGCIRGSGGYRLVHLGDQPFELGLAFRATVVDLPGLSQHLLIPIRHQDDSINVTSAAVPSSLGPNRRGIVWA